MSEDTPGYGDLEPGKLLETPTTARLRASKPTDDELRNRFIYHPPPNKERIDAHARVSEHCLLLAMDLRDTCPPGRNLSLALTHLEDVRMRANAALACDSPED